MSAEELRQIRQDTGRLQREMADALSVSLRQYKRFEQDGIPARAKVRAYVARRLRAKRPTS
jgi:transcriptional regulator with XRE-family HTH domain